MKKSKWPDFLFAVAVRLVCGVVFGALACLLLTWAGILRALTHNHNHAVIVWLGFLGFAGGLVAVFTVPRWQTPWYKRDTDEFVVTELGSEGRDWPEPGSSVKKESVTIKTVGEDGVEHEYSSMEQVPPEIRAEIETVEREAAQAKGKEFFMTVTSRRGNTITSKVTLLKGFSVYKIVDESGVERVYHSLEEMPPEIRAAIAEAENKSRK